MFQVVVEDDPVSRMLLEKTLMKAGYEVMSVQDGREALALFNEQFYPIVTKEKEIRITASLGLTGLPQVKGWRVPWRTYRTRP